MKWHKRVVHFMALCLLGIVPCLSCSQKDDVASIRAMIRKGARLAEAHDVNGIFELTTRNLRVMPGRLEGRAAKAALWRTFKYYGAMNVFHPRPNVEIEASGDRAEVRVPFLIMKRDQSHPKLKDLPEDPLAWVREVGEYADLYRLNMTLVKQDKDWLVNRATFERFTGLGFEEPGEGQSSGRL